MRKILLFIVITVYKLDAQSSYIDKFQGYWVGYISTKPSSTITYFEIIKNKNKLSITYEDDRIIRIVKTKIGFIEKPNDTILVKDLRDSGKYFCDCSIREAEVLDCFVIKGFDTDGSSYWYGNTDIFDFNKIDKLPSKVKKDISQWKNKKDKREYLREFLDMDFKEITVIKAIINSSPSIPSKQYLLKGDDVEILETKDDWLKIRYYGSKTIEGWIKKTDVE